MNMHLLKQLKFVGFGFLGYASLVILNLLVDYFLDEALAQIAAGTLLILCMYLLGRGIASILRKD